jgi:hypothetical protein
LRRKLRHSANIGLGPTRDAWRELTSQSVLPLDMPKIENLSRFAATDLPSLDRQGRGLLLVCVSGRFALPPPGKATDTALQPTEDQSPPSMEDVYWGEPGGSSLKHEGQSCFHRPGTDIYLLGSAWARLGRPAIAVPVNLQVGPCYQRMAVIGDRFWRRGAIRGTYFSSPEPFASLPLVYERAFGGTAAADLCEPRNPVGRGLYRSSKEAPDRPLPNIENPKALIRDLKDRPAPIGVGPIARHWQPRLRYAGTYDEKWVKKHAPLWPKDFDERFFCAASPGLTSPEHLAGGEPVVLEGVSPDGAFQFALPKIRDKGAWYRRRACSRLQVPPPGRGSVAH